jgi:hypothetical protein
MEAERRRFGIVRGNQGVQEQGTDARAWCTTPYQLILMHHQLVRRAWRDFVDVSEGS